MHQLGSFTSEDVLAYTIRHVLGYNVCVQDVVYNVLNQATSVMIDMLALFLLLIGCLFGREWKLPDTEQGCMDV